MSWHNIINKKYSEDTTFANFDNIEKLIDAMLRNDVVNSKSLSNVYKNVKSGKINKSRRKDYLMMFKKYVTRKHGLREQWEELVLEGKF
tara:strand:+ start:284 stop:550 length:267 start_codon:yes stop_codon:yes gene_type:complete